MPSSAKAAQFKLSAQPMMKSYPVQSVSTKIGRHGRSGPGFVRCLPVHMACVEVRLRRTHSVTSFPAVLRCAALCAAVSSRVGVKREGWMDEWTEWHGADGETCASSVSVHCRTQAT